MTSQEAFLAGHCPVTGRYFEPWMGMRMGMGMRKRMGMGKGMGKRMGDEDKKKQ